MVKSAGGPKRLYWHSLGLERPVPPGLWPVGSPMPPVRTLLRELAQERDFLLVDKLAAEICSKDELCSEKE